MYNATLNYGKKCELHLKKNACDFCFVVLTKGTQTKANQKKNKNKNKKKLVRFGSK